MEVDLFGIKFGKDTESSNRTDFKAVKEYKITKQQLLDKLGFYQDEVSFIAYDYKTGILTIKTK